MKPDFGWTDRRKQEAPPDAERVLVWHIYNGAMVMRTNDMNELITHWMYLPTEDAPWHDTKTDRPTQGDADETGCVIGMDCDKRIRVVGWHQIGAKGAAHYEKWMRIP